MAAAGLAGEIRDAFAAGNISVTDEQVLDKCARLCEQHGLDASEFLTKWEAYCIKNKRDVLTAAPTAEDVANLERALAGGSSARKRARGGDATSPTVAGAAAARPAASPLLDNSSIAALYGVQTPDHGAAAAHTHAREQVQRTPESQRKRARGGLSPSSFVSPQKSDAFLQRKRRGELECSSVGEGRGPQNVLVANHVPHARAQVHEPGVLAAHNANEAARHMYSPLHERAAELVARVRTLQEALITTHKLPDPPFEVGVPSQDEIVCVGRVCSEEDDTALTPSTIMLEGMNGRRVHLHVGELGAYSLFPGQVIAVRGSNSSGSVMTAKQLYANVPPPPLAPSQRRASSAPLSMMVASGPFTTDDNTAHEPLKALLAEVDEKKPSLLVLVGPFVSANTANLLRTQDVTFDDLYNDVMALVAEQAAALPDMRVVVVPSIDDVHADRAFPQAPLPRPPALRGAVAERISFHPNPCTLCINDVTVAICANHVVEDMLGRAVERVRQVPGRRTSSNRISRTAHQLVAQRSFYPMYPPAKGANVNVLQQDKFVIPATPDVLITPSRLKAMTKRAGRVTWLNPGPLTKTYATVSVHPAVEEGQAVVGRCRVDVWRV